MLSVPAAARTACWLNAWIARRESADQAISGLAAPNARVEFRGLGADRPLTPALLLGEVRRLGVTRATVALPTPGDLIGLGGPSPFNTAATEAGQAVLLHGTGQGLIPTTLGTRLVWRTAEARPATYLPDIATADRGLRLALLQAADDLADLDVASWSPDAADALLNIRSPVAFEPPMSFASSAAARTATSGLRARRIVELALADEGGAVTSDEIGRRREALRPLRRAGQAAVVAACSSLDGR